MKIVALGLNHKSAPVGVREKMAFAAAQTQKALNLLKEKFPSAEFVLLSTCNRVELYCASKRTDAVSEEAMVEFLSNFHGIALKDFRKFLYVYNDEAAVRHLLTVASSLDSMVVGELQIINQVRQSYKTACTAKSTGKILNRLFHCAFATSKKIHTATGISTGRVSVAGVAVESAGQLFDDLSSAKTVVIGAGEMGQLLIQHLLQMGGKDITVVNRSFQRAADVAEQYGITAEKWKGLNDQLIDADIIIAAAEVKDYLFDKESFEKMISRRNDGPLLIIDIAVPRNFAPQVDKIKNVHLYSIDDLSCVAEQNSKTRERDVAEGKWIIDESVGNFMDWFMAREIGPLIGRMKEKFARIGHTGLESFFAQRGHNPADLTAKQPYKKLLHGLIEKVNVVAKERGPDEAAKMINSFIRQAEEISSQSAQEDV